MEYLEGETLAARLAKGAQGAPGGDRALGLEARQGHADKMGVKLLDFGLRGWTLPAGDSRLNVFVDSDGEQALD